MRNHITYNDFIELYKSKDVVFNILRSDLSYSYCNNLYLRPEFSSLTDIPVDERKSIDLVRYDHVLVPQCLDKKSIRLKKITDFKHYKGIPTVKNLKEVISTYRSTILGKNTKVAISSPPLYEVLSDFYTNINFRFQDELTITIKNGGDIGDIDGCYAIRIPLSMYKRGIEFFRQFYDGPMCLGETTFVFNRGKGFGICTDKILFLKGPFMAQDDFVKFLRTAKLFNQFNEHEPEQLFKVHMFLSGNFKKEYNSTVLGSYNLKETNDMLGELYEQTKVG